MYFLNLSAAEFLALFAAASGLVTMLYLLDRSKRKQVVATLRFWTSAIKPTETRRRRRIRQPLSLALQILAIACLLLAAAQLRWGSGEDASRDHVLVLDTSAWMSARGPGGLLLDEGKRLATAYVRALPAGDRVMLLRAGALTTPVTAFESDRAVVEKAIQGSRAGAGALRLDDALRFARRIQAQHAQRPGEIVFAGCGRTAESDADWPDAPNLRALLVPSDVENAGLRKIGLRQSAKEANAWDIYVSVRNYGRTSRWVELAIQFAGSPAGFRKLQLKPEAEAEVTLPLRTRAAGALDVRLFPGDAFPGDDAAVLELPARRSARVVAYTERPALFQPLLDANPFIEAVYRKPSEYAGAEQDAIIILDGFAPAGPRPANTIWIEPPAGNAPAAVKGLARSGRLRHWHSDHPISSGLRTEDLVLSSATVYHASPEFEPVAQLEEGPVILASSGQGGASGKAVVLGFHPMRSPMRYEVSAPLLFGNIIRWMDAGVFRRLELTAESVGAVELRLDDKVDRSGIRVTAEDGAPLPVTVHGRMLRFFSPAPGVVRVTTPDAEMVYSLTLPDFAAAAWAPPANAATGVPKRIERVPAFRELWQWLAILGGCLLLAEWVWFGRFRKAPGTRVGRGGIGERLKRWKRPRSGSGAPAAPELAPGLGLRERLPAESARSEVSYKSR